MKVINDGTRIPIMMWGDDIEDECLVQAKNLANLPFAFHHVALCPDKHTGYGMPIGGVLATEHYVVPNAIGVDIGCGMHAIRTNTKTEVLRTPHAEHGTVTRAILHQIQRDVPIGNRFGSHKEAQPNDEALMEQYWLEESTNDPPKLAEYLKERSSKQLGTLGGGNHFIELDQDEDGYVWIMLHSGSRGFGFSVCDHYNKLAKQLNDRYFSSIGPKTELNFLHLDSPEGRGYVRWSNLALTFAAANRARMLKATTEAFTGTLEKLFPGLQHDFTEEIDTHHNYGVYENHFGRNVYVTRKGAVRARAGEMCIMPGSMETGSYITRGLGNVQSFTSAPHGAGRRMSRKKAKAARTVEDMQASLQASGIELVTDSGISGVLDEGGHSYKELSQVLHDSEGLVEPVFYLTPLGVIKGSESRR